MCSSIQLKGKNTYLFAREWLYLHCDIADSGNRRQEQTYVRTVLHEKFVNMTWSDKAVRDDFVHKLHNSTICHECLERKDGLYAVKSKAYLNLRESFSVTFVLLRHT